MAYCDTTHCALLHTDFEATIPASDAKAERDYHLDRVPTIKDLGLHTSIQEYIDDIVSYLSSRLIPVASYEQLRVSLRTQVLKLWETRGDTLSQLFAVV